MVRAKLMAKHSLLVGTSRENVGWTPYYFIQILLFQLNLHSFINEYIEYLVCWLWSLVFDFRRWCMRWWKYFRQSRMKADRFWSEIGIFQFLLDLLQFRFSMFWGTKPVPFGTRAIKIRTRSIPVGSSSMRRWS